MSQDGIERAERVAKALGVLFSEARVPIIVVRQNGAFVSANAAAVAQYGWALEELLSMRIQDLQAHHRPLEDDLARAMAGDAAPLDRRPHKRRDGSVVWVVPKAGPITIDGETYIVSILQDVTTALDAERRARAATLANLRDRQLVLNAVVTMIGEREVNRALDVLARSFGEAIGRATTVWLPERAGSRVLRVSAWHAVSEEGLRQLPHKRIDLDRERFARLAWDSGTGFTIQPADLERGTVEHTTFTRMGPGVVAPLLGRDGPHGLLYGVPRSGEDLSRALTLATTLGTFGGMVLEAVQLEARAEVEWHSASERLSDGIALLDEELRIVRVNSAELALLAKEAGDVLGRPCREIFGMCKHANPCVHAIARDERRRTVTELIGHTSRRPLRIEVIPAEANAVNIAVINVAHDLAEERAARTQLVTNDRLASIGRLAAGVAHEINNPAAFVMVNLGVLRDRFAAGTARSQDVLAMLDESMSGMDRIREIVRDLKGLARDRSIDVVDLGALAQSALRMTAHETRGRAKVERIAEDGACARVRGARITQVVLNLVLNAAQALPPGRADNRITIRTRRAADRALIEVIDNGTGIDAAIAPRIFEPFFTTREGTGGTGLGLWLAKSIVEEEGGLLSFRDEPGGGTRFLVDLPAATPETPHPSSPRDRAQAP